MSSYNTYDILLKNLKIVDGTGAPAFYGSIGIKGDTIAAIGEITGTADLELDLSGLAAAPGFIDMHNHSDKSIFDEPMARNYTSQGVTTLVVGNCGVSAAPFSQKNKKYLESMELTADDHDWTTFGKYLDDLDKQEKAVNIAALVGHGNVRGAVLGMEARKPAPKELEKMKALVREAMADGAFGMSSGLIYDPGVFADADELTELSKVVAEYGGVYSTHIRNESDLLVESVIEAINIGRRSGARVQVSHHKASGKRNWGLVRNTLELMEYYRRFGLEITCDVYPCTSCSTDLYSFFPNWSRQGGKEEFLSIIKDDEIRKKIKMQLARPSEDWENILLDAGFDELIIASSKKLKEFEGKTAREIARELKMDPYDAIFYLVENDPEISVIAGGMSEEDVKYIIKHPLSMIGSDGYVKKPGEGVPHPRNYRAFTKVLEKYVREEGILSLEQAVHKMAYCAAWKLGLQDRGLIKQGFKADISIFDFWNVKYESEFGDPHHYSKGMTHVIINGRFAIRDEKFTGEFSGKALRKGR